MIGVTELSISKRSGIFHCPGCRDTRPCKVRGTYRFLTIYFVPLIPLELVSEHVRCQICREQYPTRVLQPDYTKRLDPPAVTRAVILAAMRVALVDDRPSRDELLELQRLIWDRARIRASTNDILAARHLVVGEQGKPAGQYLSRGLGQIQQERAVRDVFVVVSADRHLRPEQVSELASLPSTLGISVAKFKRLVLQSVSEFS